jgi:iron complex outermembrane receptor protein
VGLRGDLPVWNGRIDWKVGAYRTDVTDDIITTASNIQGRGVFRNVPATRRQGIEAGAHYVEPRWMAYASYSFIDATYQFNGTVAAPNNPFADADGNIFIVPGNKIPAIPAHQFKAGGEVAVTSEWKVARTLRWSAASISSATTATKIPRCPPIGRPTCTPRIRSPRSFRCSG